MRSQEESPETQELLAGSRQRQVAPLSPRERVVEGLVGGAFAAAAAALLAAYPPAHLDWAAMAIAVTALMVTSLVHFEVGSTYTVPLQLAFVPTLFFLPPALVPLCVVTAFLLVKLPEVLSGRKPVGRLLPAVGDSWFAVGPALVFALASPGQPDGHDWPIYLVALGAQFALDFAALARSASG